MAPGGSGGWNSGLGVGMCARDSLWSVGHEIIPTGGCAVASFNLLLFDIKYVSLHA